MKESTNIAPLNDKNQRHGYWEQYFYNGKLFYKCVFINGEKIGFEEWYSSGKISHKNYYL